MASAVVGQPGAELRIGDVISRAAALWAKLIGPFGLVYAIAGLPTVLQAMTAGPQSKAGVAALSLSLVLAILLGGLVTLVAHAGLFVAAAQVLDGGRPAVMSALEQGLRRFLPLLGAWICVGLLTLLGSMLLIVPGLIVYMMYFVVSPVCVLEGRGPIASMNRSAALTKGNRWRLFGLFLVLLVLTLLVAAAALLAKLALGAAGGAIVQLAVNAAVGVFGTAAGTVAYRDLVGVRDGIGGGRLASVFD